jgi:hypothetical protein
VDASDRRAVEFVLGEWKGLLDRLKLYNEAERAREDAEALALEDAARVPPSAEW